MLGSLNRPVLLLSLGVVVACGGGDSPPAVDSGASLDGATDASDGNFDATTDAIGTVDAATDSGPVACLTGSTYTFVLSFADVGRETALGSGIVPGFDLDGRVSNAMDAQGCNHPDFTSPPPDSLPGVDNQLGPVTDSVGFPLNFSGSIASGSLLVLLRLRGVDDLTNDDCIEIDVLGGLLPVGVAAPTLGADGRPLPGQTFDIDARTLEADMMTPTTQLRGSIVAGRVRASSTAPWPWTFPTMAAGRVTLVLGTPVTRFNVAVDAVTQGVLGGALDVDMTVVVLAMVAAGIPMAVVRTVLEAQADLSPDPLGGCKGISIGVIFDAVPAVEGVVR